MFLRVRFRGASPTIEVVIEESRPRSVGRRLRLGDYRLICKIEDDRLIVLVLRVGHRKEMYRGVEWAA
jgi:mRNA-degrading endonuclease RelE of RelBE toxin-antitoxin system